MLKCYYESGFTLVELLVSVGIIVMVVTMAAGIYVYTLGGQQKNISATNLQQEGEYLLSLIAKEVRNNRIDYDYYGGTVTFPEDELALIDDSGSPYTYYIYRKNSITPTRVEKCQKQGSQPYVCAAVTMAEVKVDKLDFYINPTSSPYGVGGPWTAPRVTVILDLRSSKERFGAERLHLQETVLGRIEEKK